MKTDISRPEMLLRRYIHPSKKAQSVGYSGALLLFILYAVKYSQNKANKRIDRLRKLLPDAAEE